MTDDQGSKEPQSDKTGIDHVLSSARLFGLIARGNSAAITLFLFCGLPMVQFGSMTFYERTTAIAAEIASFSATNNSTITLDGSNYRVQNANQSYSLTNPDSDTLRFELRAGDHWSSPEYTDPRNCQRSEIAGATVYQPDTQINISYQFMVDPGPVDDANGPGKFTVLGQLHADTLTGASPPFAVELVNGDHMAIDIGTHNPVYVYIDPNPIQRGHYYSMNIQVKFASKGDGFLRVWRDDVNVVDHRGPLGTGTGTYWKEGVYRSSTAQSVAVSFRRLKIAATADVDRRKVVR